MESARNMWVKPVVKSSTTKLVRKSKPIAVEVALANNTKGPNMSRKNQGTKIYSFPSFDKCDSLSFFPSTFTSFINSGDINSLRRLMKTRIDKDCTVDLCGCCVITVPQFIEVFECMNELHPDSMYCVDRTGLAGNEIRSLLHYKYTESKPVREGMKRNFPDNKLVDFCVPPSRNLVKLQLFLDSQPRKVSRELAKIDYEAEEMVVYGTTNMILTFDDYTKTIVHIKLEDRFTSFRLV